MSFKNRQNSYGSVAKFFHWVIGVLLIGMLVYGFFLDDFPKDIQPITYNIHKLTGLTILTLMILRGLWALINVKPTIIDAPHWQRFAERSVHYLFYLLVIVMPLSGWIGSVASNHPPHLGNFEFRLPIPQSEAIDNVAFQVHGYTAFILIILVCLHVLAALYHHFIKRDNVLIRMLPDCCHR